MGSPPQPGFYHSVLHRQDQSSESWKEFPVGVWWTSHGFILFCDSPTSFRFWSKMLWNWFSSKSVCQGSCGLFFGPFGHFFPSRQRLVFNQRRSARVLVGKVQWQGSQDSEGKGCGWRCRFAGSCVPPFCLPKRHRCYFIFVPTTWANPCLLVASDLQLWLDDKLLDVRSPLSTRA